MKNNFFSESVKTLSYIFPAEVLISGAKQNSQVLKYKLCPLYKTPQIVTGLKTPLFEKAEEGDIKTIFFSTNLAQYRYIHWKVRLYFVNYKCLGIYRKLFCHIYKLQKVVKKMFAQKKCYLRFQKQNFTINMFKCQRIFTKFDYILGHRSKCNSFYEATITLIPKPEKDATKKTTGQYH